jgi:hypothetical protein
VYSQHDSQDKKYLAPDTFISLGDRKRVTTFTNFMTPRQEDGNIFQSMLIEQEVICSSKRIQITKQWLFFGPNATGKVVHIDVSHFEGVITPGTYGDALGKLLCERSSYFNEVLDGTQKLNPEVQPISINLERFTPSLPSMKNEVTSDQGSVPPSSSVQPPSAGNTAKDYEVITVRQPTASELVLVQKSSAREFLADGGTVTVASADLNGDGVPELIVFAHSSMWCGSGGCASKVLMTRSDGNITTYDNDCMYFGESGKIGVGSNGSGRFASMYPLNDDNTLAIMDKNGMPDTGKPIVCHLAQAQR